MTDIDAVWARIRRHAKEPFNTKIGPPYSYEVPGNYQIVDRADRSPSRTNFAKALAAMPADGPDAIKDRLGASYTWVLLMEPRIRLQDW